jgi:RNA polymerase sigma factor (sigma-70 family)
MGIEQHPTDEELIGLYRETGDLKILGKLYDPYMSLVYGVCLKYLKDREESRDAVMQIFEKLIILLKTHEVTNFRSWLYVTSRNYCLMQLRSAKSRRKEEISENFMETTGMTHPETGNELELNVVKLEKCLEELGLEQKQCVSLFYLHQKCYKEICQLTGFDDNKVKSYIQNGKRNLKICMEKNG